jgi:hypothetical protein
MANREIDEAEYAALSAVNGTVSAILSNPTARALMLKATKVARPNAVIPEIDAAEPINAAVSDVKGEIAKLREDLAERDRKAEEAARVSTFASKWADQQADLRRAGWRSAGIEAVVKFAEENGISDLSIAADAYAVRHPEPEPSAVGNGAWSMFGTEGGKEDTFVQDMMKSGGNDERRLDQEIASIIRDSRPSQR